MSTLASSLIKTTKSVHGVNPKNLIEKIVRMKIQSHNYWKEKCIGLNEESLVDRAMDLDSFGGSFGGSKQPTHFLCLMLKMLQIQPEKDIVLEFIRNEDFKYVRLIGAFYMRLVGKPKDIYTCLEPLYNDYRTVRKRVDTGYERIHIDEFIKELLTGNYSCDIALPHLPSRSTLESSLNLPKRISPLVELNLIDIGKITLEEKENLLNKVKENKEKLKQQQSEKSTVNKTNTNNIKMDQDDKNQSKYNRPIEERHKDNQHRDDRHRNDDRYRDNRYRDDRYRDDGRRDNVHRDDRDRDDGHRDDRYRNDRHRDDRYRDDRYRDNRYRDDRYREDEKKRDRDDDEEGAIEIQSERPKKKRDISKYEKTGNNNNNNNSNSNNNNNNNNKGTDEKSNSSEAAEIAEMNALRLKLGLAPLK
ncbi:putative U4/U6.U5 small nuclear ribonucleoparticle-associated protein [Tieghemostelium lacteum]|uniref:Pre-mRNA-splicing factor 38 n=1 Tax=Tieghemostelium lacteum TaxID=361077 RepID=A0A151Z730_TIELA|nr:putative U4/U6.U5 small nuclear ribonucleoparticle-associated protein [Tieghemostelium lacteum]|eukprot:KYQ89737.1 putative U4/U6.U5 small nuclear ribonucleoparticle-associated protein [Tieghemostelium lacteum]